MDFLFPLAEAASNAVNAVTEPVTPMWLQVIYGIATTAITLFVLPWLKQHAASAKAAADSAAAQGNLTALQQRQLVLQRIEAFLMAGAATIANERWPQLARKLQTGQLATKEAIKAELYAWGDELKQQAIAQFKTEGIDLMAVVGEQYLDVLVDKAAAATSPFPGKEVAHELLDKKVIPLILEKGIAWLRQKYLGALPEHETTTVATPVE